MRRILPSVMAEGPKNKRGRTASFGRMTPGAERDEGPGACSGYLYDAHDSYPGDEGDHTADNASSCPITRKRELERQRRNLVNMRFAELDRALVTSPVTNAPSVSHPARRIDREAILKDATARIGALTAELGLSKERLASMNTEVQSLRAEKVELRADKSYLHTELSASRTEAQRLRNDNIHLWQAIRSSGGLKSVLNADVAKIPVDILLRAQLANNSGQGNPNLAPRGSGELQGHDTQAPGSLPDGRIFQPVRPERAGNDSNALEDSFLVFQSPEELCELISSYQDAAMSEPQISQAPTDQGEHQNLSAAAHPLALVNSAQHMQAQVPQVSYSNGNEGGRSSDKNKSGDYAGEDFLDDIAYCA
jgi:Helix-loop-helix DNA-binding domain